MLALAVGCGTTRTTDTSRTATEELLISDAVDRTLEKMDFKQLSGFAVYLDTSRLSSVTDRDYLVGSVRKKLVADGAALEDDRSKADIIVELVVGALGTNRYEWFVGVPQVTLPPGALPSIPFLPELPVVKEIKQQGVAKIEAFAYDAQTGLFIAHSGSQRSGTNNNSIYFLGLGPFENGTVTDRIKLAGSPLPSFGDQAGDAMRPGLAARPKAVAQKENGSRDASDSASPASSTGSQETGETSLSRVRPQGSPAPRPSVELFFQADSQTTPEPRR